MGEITWSVVITTKNRWALAKRAIDSAINQTLPCEVVVVDDGSTDETPNLPTLYPTVKYLRNITSIGHSGAANQGIRLASGTWIKPLDDDDYLNPICLAAMTEALRGAPAERHPVIVTSAAINVNPEGEVVGRRPPTLPVTRAVTLDSATLRRLMMIDQAPIGAPVQVGHERQAALDCGGWNENNRSFADDTEFFIRLAHQGGAVFIPERLGYRTVWEGNFSNKVTALQKYQSIISLKKNIGNVPKDVVSGLALRMAFTALLEKDSKSMLSLLGIYACHPLAVVHLFRRHLFTDAREALATL